MKPVVVDDVTLAFPAKVIGKYLPKWEAIPAVYKLDNNQWAKLAEKWVFDGVPKAALKVKREFDGDTVLRHLKTCLGSFEPKHEHKIAGVAYLMSLWLDP